MSYRVIEAVLDRSRSKGAERLILLTLAAHADDEGVAWPSWPTLARRANVSQSSVHRALEALQDLAELEVRSKAGPKGCNLYRITLLGTSQDGSSPSQAGTSQDESSPSQAGTEPSHVGREPLPGWDPNRKEPSGTASRKAGDGQGVADVEMIEGLPADLRTRVEPVRALLAQLADANPRARIPTLAAVARAIGDHPERDHGAVARDYRAWQLDSVPERSRHTDLIRGYRNQLARPPRNGRQPERLDHAGDLSRFDGVEVVQ